MIKVRNIEMLVEKMLKIKGTEFRYFGRKSS